MSSRKQITNTIEVWNVYQKGIFDLGIIFKSPIAAYSPRMPKWEIHIGFWRWRIVITKYKVPS